tara:strand:- start:660 stop:1238 length:579 start_codon:yes stop_codon:yes gene_type:complete
MKNKKNFYTIKKNINDSINNLKILNDQKYFDQILKISNEIIRTIKNKKKIIFCGNGGSAADSQHLCAELVSKFLKNRKPFSSISLTTNTSTITSISNDFSFDKIFSKQIEAVGVKGDFLFAISTSGKSKNVKEAIKVAKKKGIKTFLLTGLKNKSRNLSDIVLEVPASRVDRIQEMHILVGHIICEIVENTC